MNSGSSGGFNRTTYDRCAYQKKLYESVDPLGHIMYPGKFENCRKCVQDETQFWRPFDAKIVDAESELKNITRIYTRCPQYKYSPACKTSRNCISTFDKSNPIVLAQENCPIVRSNIPKMYGTGYNLQTEPFCKPR